MRRKILVIEDDKKTAQLVQLYLEKDGYQVETAYDGIDGLDLARRSAPDLVVLDVMLPSIDGLDIARILTQETKVPIIMLTARSTENDMLSGLGMGADDYIIKPFSPRELVARVRTVLRRVYQQSSEEEFIQRGGLIVDMLGHEVRVRGVPVELTPKEFRLLSTMAREPGRAFSRLELLDRVFGYDFGGLENTLNVHIVNLRKKIEPNPTVPQYIVTIYGLGYKFVDAKPETSTDANTQ